jgi:hypothetical protein
MTRNHENKLGVALTKEACPLCGSLHDKEIVMNTRLSESLAKKVEELHGKVTGLMKHPCDSCKDMMSKGFLLIGIVEEKSGKTYAEIYRSGNQWVISNESAAHIFEGNPQLEKGFSFIDVKAAEKLGLPDVNLKA